MDRMRVFPVEVDKVGFAAAVDTGQVRLEHDEGALHVQAADVSLGQIPVSSIVEPVPAGAVTTATGRGLEDVLPAAGQLPTVAGC